MMCNEDYIKYIHLLVRTLYEHLSNQIDQCLPCNSQIYLDVGTFALSM